MTLPSPLRELAADIRPDDARSDVYAVSNAQLSAWADKLESLAGEYAVAPREATKEMLDAAHRENDKSYVLNYGRAADPEDLYAAMIEAAERQETGR